jgi:O-antigen ligase
MHRIFAALFLASPLIVLTNFPYPYSLPRWIFISLLCSLWSILLIYDVVKKNTNLHFSYIDWAFIVFIAVLGISTITSVDRTHSLWGSMERSFAFSLWPLLLVAFFGLKHALSKPENRTFLFRFFSATILVAAFWGILQKLIPGFSHTFSGARIGGTLGNAIFYGSYLTLSIGLLFLGLLEEKRFSRWWNLTTLSIIGAALALLLTQTRGPLLGLCVGIFVALVTCFYKKTSHKRIAIISIVALMTLALGGGFIAYNKNLITPTTITTRFYNWSMAWNGFKDKPFFGWGPENYNLATDQNYISKLTKYSIAETHADKPHNYLLELAVTSGIFGVLAYIALLISAMFELRSAKLSVPQACTILGILAAAVSQNLTSFETHGSIIVFIFALALIGREGKNISTKRLQLTILSLASLCTILVVFYGTLPLLKDSAAYLKAIKLDAAYADEHNAIKQLQGNLSKTPFPRDYFTALSFGVVGQYWQNPQGYARLTASEQQMHVDDLAWLRTTNDTLDTRYATNGAWKLVLANSAYQLYSLTKDSSDGSRAEKLFTDYAKLAPQRQEPLMQLGQLSLLRNNPEKAIEYFDAAINLDPSLETPYWQRSLALFAQKKTVLAWKDIAYLMSVKFSFTPPQIANYIYNQLLENSMQTEANEFKTYFEGGSF